MGHSYDEHFFVSNLFNHEARPEPGKHSVAQVALRALKTPHVTRTLATLSRAPRSTLCDGSAASGVALMMRKAAAALNAPKAGSMQLSKVSGPRNAALDSRLRQGEGGASEESWCRALRGGARSTCAYLGPAQRCCRLSVCYHCLPAPPYRNCRTVAGRCGSQTASRSTFVDVHLYFI